MAQVHYQANKFGHYRQIAFIGHSWQSDTILRYAMPKLRPSVLLTRYIFRFTCSVWILGVCLAACASSQTAVSLSQIKKIYVAPLGQGKLGDEFRERIINRLRKDGSVAVVDSRQQADAVLSGDGQIWVTGHVSNNPRTPSNAVHAVYSGFLSARVTDKKNEVMWSYLVTPRKFAWGGIVHDLADNLTAKLLDARLEKSDTEAAVPSPNSAEVFIRGAGATFPAPLYQKWFQSIQEQQPNERIGYDGIGSEEGIRQLVDGKVDFAASDMPLSDERMSQLGAKFQHFASVLGAVVPIYNIAGIARPLNFTPEVLAEIYLGKITRWSDPKIRAANHGVSLPDADIVVVHRSDGSGTTFVWSDFLSKVSSVWNAGVGRSSELKWPVGIGEERNEGVARTVQQTPNSIGYVEMVFALQHQLSFGAVRNASGEFVRADLASVTAAAASAAANMTSDFRISITNAPGAGAYPIASFTWLLLPANADPKRKAALHEMLQWILTSGQKECSELGYAPLPREIADRELNALAK
jgi:phosphate transport system substrate-binding protein